MCFHFRRSSRVSAALLAIGTAPLLLALMVVLIASPATAQVVLPYSTTIALSSVGQDETFTVDLGSLPLRPVLVVEASPDAHPDINLELEIADLPQIGGDANSCPGPTDSFVSTPSPGAASVSWDAWNCDPRIDAFAGTTATVIVRALDFGSWSPPADVDLVIRGETRVPFGTELAAFAPTLDPQTLDVPITKDTTLYERDGLGSNGLGEFLWAGTDAEPDMYGGTDLFAIRSLLAFNVAAIVPATAVVDDVTIDVEVLSLVGSGNVLDLHRVAADVGAPPVPWPEGDADAAGDEFLAGASTIPAATWLTRESPALAWGIVGGDPASPFPTPLASLPLATTGPVTLASPALTAAVADMAASGAGQDGFLLASPLAANDQGIQLASKDHVPNTIRPKMTVSFTPTEPYQGGQVATGAKSFIDEGEDLRWIYDLDEDDVFETDIGGVCTITDPSPLEGAIELPYTYDYAGDPSFTGLDCCTWQIQSAASGTVGAGQALFFHNLDPLDPANLPADFDGDGILDLCDNCLWLPNGPLLGTCLTGPSTGDPCRSELECVGGGCSLSQEDDDGDFVGNACPEPGFGLGLALCSAAAAGIGRRGRRPPRTRGRRPTPDT